MSNIIRILKGPDRVRLRPAVIFGDDGLDGAKHAFEMMMCIMAAECIDGCSNRLDVTLYEDHSVGMKNFGRGIFFEDAQDTDDTVWKEMFCEIFAGPKFGNQQADDYRYSIFYKAGTAPKRDYRIDDYDDLYLCAIQYASEYMDVTSVRDGYEYALHFEKGMNIGGLSKTACNRPSGTQIKFKLDRQVFLDTAIPPMFLEEQLEALALQNPGVTCSLNIESRVSKQTFSFPSGISDYIKKHSSINKSCPIYTDMIEGTGQERYNRPAYKAKVEVGISFETDNGYIKCYHNQRELTYGGTHTQNIVAKIQDYIICQTDIDPSIEQLKKHLQLVVISYSSTIPYWENGTRRSICNTVIRDMAEDTLGDKFRDFLIVNKAEIRQNFK